jgi:site-specific DNA-methyltransferase (adenine-specific)
MKYKPEYNLHKNNVACKLFVSDANEFLINLREQYLHIAIERPKLIFFDPPFNMSRNYDSCSDNVSRVEYLSSLKSWIENSALLLCTTGSLWINLPDQWAAHAVVFAEQFGMKLENWCIWHYRFGVNQPKRFIKSKNHALWFSFGSPEINPEAAKVPSDRATIYNDGRIFESESGGMRMDLDVWGFDQYWGRVQGNNKERRHLHDNQLPELYLKRIVEVCSNPGDLVVDPFCGSGTTATVAVELGRNVYTNDISSAYIDSAYNRVMKGMVRK